MAIGQVDPETLTDLSQNGTDPNLHLKIWRRRHIENYLLWPSAIARACGKPEADIINLLATHALVVPPDFASRHVADAMILAPGKQILCAHPQSIAVNFGLKPIDIAREMLGAEVPEDVRYMIELIRDVCAA